MFLHKLSLSNPKCPSALSMFALKEFNLDHPLVLFILNSSPAPEFILQGISKKSIAAIKEHSLSKLEMFEQRRDLEMMD